MKRSMIMNFYCKHILSRYKDMHLSNKKIMMQHLNVADLDCGDGSEAGASATSEIARHFYRVWGAAQVWVDPISAWK